MRATDFRLSRLRLCGERNVPHIASFRRRARGIKSSFVRTRAVRLRSLRQLVHVAPARRAPHARNRSFQSSRLSYAQTHLSILSDYDAELCVKTLPAITLNHHQTFVVKMWCDCLPCTGRHGYGTFEPEQVACCSVLYVVNIGRSFGYRFFDWMVPTESIQWPSTSKITTGKHC